MDPLQVNQDQVLAILGAKEVEVQLLRLQLSQSLKKLEELEAKIKDMTK